MRLWLNQERLALCGVGRKLSSEHLKILLIPFGPQYFIKVCYCIITPPFSLSPPPPPPHPPTTPFPSGLC